jgi:hypothetical protein
MGVFAITRSFFHFFSLKKKKKKTQICLHLYSIKSFSHKKQLLKNIIKHIRILFWPKKTKGLFGFAI